MDKYKNDYKNSQKTNLIINSFKGQSHISKEFVKKTLKTSTVHEVIKKQYMFNKQFYNMN